MLKGNSQHNSLRCIYIIFFMKYFKKLVGDRIYLSPRSAEDYEKYAEWLNDFQVTDYTGKSSKILTREAEKEYLEKNATN